MLEKLQMLKKITLCFLASFLLPAYAYAAVPASIESIVVHGEINHIAKALRRLALIMTDDRYLGLFFGIIILTLIGGVIMIIINAVTKGKIAPSMWLSLLATLLFGIIIYHTFIRQTTDMLVTDETIGGKWEVVAGVPDGVAFLAGLLNKIENGVIDVIWTAGDIMGFREQAGGVGFNIINKAFTDRVDLSGFDSSPVTGKYFNMSIKRYIEDCFLFELGRPASLININDINDNTDFISILGLAASPAIQTIWYDSSNPNGTSRTCHQDWTNNVQPYLLGLLGGNATVTSFWDQKCAKARFSATTYPMAGPPINTVCRNKVEDLVSSLMGVAITSEQLMLQHLIATELKAVAEEASPDDHVRAVGNFSKGSELMGAGIMLNEWLPTMKGVYYAIFIGLLPFLFLLIPTPLCFRVISFIFGSFFFLTCWGICDAIIHSTAMDYAADCYTEIVRGRLGLKSMVMFESESYKAMAAFGASRLMSLSMAGVLAFTITKFGGSAFAQMIHRSPIAAGSHGAMGAHTSAMGDPSKRASFVGGVARALPTEAWASAFSTDEHTDALTIKMQGDTAKNLAIKEKMGGVDNAIDQGAGVGAMNAMDGAVKNYQLNQIGEHSGLGPGIIQSQIAEAGINGPLSKSLMTKGLDEMLNSSDLKMNPLTQQTIHGLGKADGGAWLAANGTVSRVIKPEEAVNVARMFARNGQDVNPSDIAGTKAQMSMRVGEDGGLIPTLVVAGKGVDLRKGSKSATYDNVETLESGYKLRPEDMRNAVAGGNGFNLTSAITNSEGIHRDRVKMTQADAFAKSMSSIIGRTGQIRSEVGAEGHASFTIGTPGKSVIGSGAEFSTRVGGGLSSVENENYDIYYGLARRIQDKAEQYATNPDGSLDKTRYNDAYMDDLNKIREATDAQATGQGEASFGIKGITGMFGRLPR